jgi:23S rRNA pseudouridine2605 synthase
MEVRLQKFLADAGVASRRASEKIILEGRVTVNGQVKSELGARINPAQDKVAVDGKVLRSRRKLYVVLNKPPGYICSRKDPLNRRSAMDLLPREWESLYSVGRLDYKSDGLIFFTNDGDFSLRLTHPRYGIRKKYLATVNGKLSADQIKLMTRGILDAGENLKAERVRVLKEAGAVSVVEVTMSEGKNREVRRLFQSLGLTVARLQRVQIGPIKLGELPKGRWRTLTEPEIKSLLAAAGQVANQ